MTLPTTKSLLLERDGSALHVWLNRPEARNALNEEMTDELGEVLDAIREDRTIRCVVLRGKAGYFCAGGDIKGFKSGMQGKMDHSEVAKANRSFGDLMIKINEQPQVMIMLVEGAAIGGGLGLACVGDVTIVCADTKFRLSETSLGIPPAQIAPFVTERVGLTQARRLMLTGANFKGVQAVEFGVAHMVAADTQELESMCQKVLAQIRLCAPSANATTKAIIFETMRKPRAQALDFAASGFASCMLSDEGREGVAAFVEKRPAKWAVE